MNNSKDKVRAKCLMLIIGLNKTIHHLAMANSVDRYGHVLRSEDGQVMRKVFNLKVESERKRG